jgi:hypothetical protein
MKKIFAIGIIAAIAAGCGGKEEEFSYLIQLSQAV